MTKFYFTESQKIVSEYDQEIPQSQTTDNPMAPRVSSRIHLNTCKYYVWGIKLETKVMRLPKIRVEKISLLHLKKCAVNYF